VSARATGYWITTSVIALETLAGGVTDLVRGRAMLVAGPPVVEVITPLGYPAYFLTILGVWKVLGAIVLVAPRFPRLKEWAYAGIFFELTGAAASQAIRGNWRDVPTPLILTAFTIASWGFRPPNRTLPQGYAA